MSKEKSILFNNVIADDGALVPEDIVRHMILAEITHNLAIVGDDCVFGFTMKTQNPYHDGRSEYYDIPIVTLSNLGIVLQLPDDEFDVVFNVYKTRGMDGGGYKIKYEGEFVLNWNPDDKEATS